MAILKKRTSSKQLPPARATTRAPLNSVVRGQTPAISGGSSTPITSAGGSPSSITSSGSSVRPSLTSSTAPAVANQTSPKTITTSPNTAVRPSIRPNISGAGSTSNKIVDALTGAALGVGSKYLIDKLTGKLIPQKPAGGGTSGGSSTGTAGKTPSTPKPPPLTSKTDAEIKAELDRVKASEQGSTPPMDAVMSGDGTYTVTRDGIKTSYDKDGNVVETTSADSGGAPDGELMQDSLGNIYKTMPDGTYELVASGNGSSADDITPVDNGSGSSTTAGNNVDFGDMGNLSEAPLLFEEPGGGLSRLNAGGTYDPVSGENSTVADNDYDPYFAKRGGFITMMNKGGLANYADGGEVIDSIDNNDGTYTQYYSDGSQETFDNPTYGTVYNPDGSTSSSPMTDLPQQVLNSGNTSGNSGSGNAPSAGGLATKVLTGLGFNADTAGKIIGALPAAGAGAFISSLLSSGSNSSPTNQGVDMSKVGVINPRTTDFGIGPTKFVGYDQYGTGGGDYTPNEELLRNLNAPGYNPVNEGDYGYAPAEAPAEAPKMASGGLSSMSSPVASYYTFGQPADIMANLGMRPQPPMNPPDMMSQVGQQQPAQQAQQQGLPQQAPPLAPQQMSPTMPQQGVPQMMPQQQGTAPPMRSGGLPHASNVPTVEGRMDFRNGSAVHGAGDGQSDDIPAMLADGEYVIDAETVAQIGNGSTKAGAQALDKFREGIRAHKRSAPINKIPPKTKALTSYLKGAR